MKAVVFDANVAKYIRTLLLGKISKKFFYNRFSCIQLKDIPEPELPSENYVKIKTTYAGICGSDLNLIIFTRFTLNLTFCFISFRHRARESWSDS